ncbi:MAG: cation diffusion facilitator family transporter [Firmicutes bacterium]|nr:cation diffusion facilitator family transporter [Bacillota bacterium]
MTADVASESWYSARRLAWAFWLGLFGFVIQGLGGAEIGSMAVMANAGHLLADLGGVGLAWWAAHLEMAPPTWRNTYGYRRSGIVAALVNSLILILIALGIIAGAGFDLLHPHPVPANSMSVLAFLGLAINAVGAWVVKPDHGLDLNRRAVFWHLIGDGLGSLAVAAAAGLQAVTGWAGFDPLAAMAIAALVGWMGIRIGRESIDILMEATPRGIEPYAVLQALLADEAVLEVHHLHIWAIAPDHNALSAHVRLKDMPLSQGQALLDRCQKMLQSRFRIGHVTLQLETEVHEGAEECGKPSSR